MKKIIVLILLSILLITKVNAETVKASRTQQIYTVRSDFIETTTTIGVLKTNDGDPLYSLTPLVNMYSMNNNFNKASYDLYTNLDDKILEKIIITANLGYKSVNREDISWYYVTQYLIWSYLPNYEVSLNNQSIYEDQINELYNDVLNYLGTNIQDEYISDTGIFNLNNVDESFIVNGVSSSMISYEESLILSNVTEDTDITLSKEVNEYQSNAEIYESSNSTLISRGNIKLKDRVVHLKLNQGTIKISFKLIRNQDTEENVCYTLTYLNDNTTKDICVTSDTTFSLPNQKYGNYKLEDQKDAEHYYLFTLNEDNKIVDLEVIDEPKEKNLNVKVNYCIKDDCIYLEEVKVSIYNENKELLNNYYLNEEGSILVPLVKGKYYLKIAKVDNYEELDEIEVLIDNEDINISLTSNYNGPIDDPTIMETITNEEKEDIILEPVINEIIDEPKIVPLINKEEETPKEEPKEESIEEPIEEPKEEYINNLIPEEEDPIINPYTGDDIVIYFTMLVISSLTILGILRFKERC